MNLSTKHTFNDDWLAQALLYYQIMDKSLYQELLKNHSDNSYLFDVLVEKNYLCEQDISEFIESALKITAINLDQTKIDSKALKKVPEELCLKYLFIPFAIKGNEIHIASFNPSNMNAEREIESLTGKHVKTFFARKDQILKKINTYYSPDQLINSIGGENKQRLNDRISGEETAVKYAPVISSMAPDPEDSRPIRILIVEDYEVSRKVLRVMLQKHTDWEVEEAKDGVDAFEKIKKEIPDVILLDIMMPRMDGYELLQRLRAEPETMEIAVLIITGKKTIEDEVKSLEMGGDDYLAKPIRKEILIARIKRILDRKKKKILQSIEPTTVSAIPSRAHPVS